MKILIQHPVVFSAAIFCVLLLSTEAGRWVGKRKIATVSGHNTALEGAIFGIMGLLIAFTIAGASTRFDHRRDLIVDEANAISTAHLRLDLAPADTQPQLRDAFHRYVDFRITAYDQIADESAFKGALAHSSIIEQEIWKLAIVAGRHPDALPAVNMLLLPALNQMFDIATTRALSTLIHPPLVIYAMLLVLTMVGAVLAGFGMAASPRDWLHMLSFAAIMTVTIYVIIDIEYPQVGMITVTEFERATVSLGGRADR